MRNMLYAILIGTGILSLSGTASANANIDMTASEGDWDTNAASWNYVINYEDPGNGNTCANSSDHWKVPGWLQPVTVGPPFSGSVTRTRYVTTCKNGAYLTVKLQIKLSDCAAWICTSNFSWSEVRKHNVDYEHKWYGFVNSELDILLNPN